MAGAENPADDVSTPVVRTLSLPCAPEKAFSIFTERIGDWWPPAFTASGANLGDIRIEGEPGGNVFEFDTDGNRRTWGSVTAWEPGRRVVLSWSLGVRAGDATEVEVTFAGTGERSDVRLEHRGWGPDQADDRERFANPGGWTVVLDAYRRYAGARV
jgi:uncharacterized protein YndB with AHSA1/START domain